MTEKQQSEAYLKQAAEAPHKARADLPDIITLLGSQTPETRVNAAWAIGLVVRSHPETIPEILPRLIPYLKHSVSERDAARVLAYIADHFRDWTRTTIKERYSAEQKAGVRPFLSQLNNPDADIGPDDVFVLELLSGGQSVKRSNRSRQEDPNEEYTPSDTQDDSSETRTRSHSPPPDGRDRSVLREIERESSLLDAFERETRIASTTNMSIYKTIASSGRTSRSVVLKVLQDSTPSSAFRDEWRKHLGCWELIADHDRIAALVDSGQHPRPWVAVECLEEGSLTDQREIPMQTRLTEAQALTDAVAYAHRHGVLHGQLHPGNIRCTRPLASWSLVSKITDWGVSHTITTHAGVSTPPLLAYGAPEQVQERSDDGVDQYTDSYQLGACLYQLLTNRDPFAGSPSAVRRAVVEQSPRPPTEVNPELPARLDDILGKAMAKRKINRYESVERFRTDLEKILNGSGR